MKRIIPVLFILITLVSCTTTKITEDRPFVSRMGSDGDYIFTTTENLIDTDKFNIYRISGCFNPETSFVYGVLETDIPKAKFNTAMRFVKTIQKAETGKLKAWYDTQNKIYYCCVQNGIVLFASEQIEKVYEEIFVSSNTSVDHNSVLKMLNAQTGFYIKNPKIVPDIGLNISESNIEKFESICATINGEILEVNFEMTCKDFADSFFKIIKANVIGRIIQSGNKPNLQELKNNILQEEKNVILKELDFPQEKQIQILNTFIEEL